MLKDDVCENCLAITFKLAESELFGYEEHPPFSGALTSGKHGKSFTAFNKNGGNNL
jgi:transcriptional regulator with PAS, ATPase and Fis domain